MSTTGAKKGGRRKCISASEAKHLLAALEQHVEHQADEGLLQGWDADQQVQQALALLAHAGSPVHGREQQATQLRSHCHINHHHISLCRVKAADSSVLGSVGGKPLCMVANAPGISRWTDTSCWLCRAGC